MIPVVAEPRPWSRRCWWGVVVLVFIVQLALIFWLGSTAPIRPRPGAPNLTLRFAGTGAAELLALTDPTLFALPYRQNFVLPARSGSPRPAYHASLWPVPTTQLFLALGQARTVFSPLIETNDFTGIPLLIRPHPSPTIPSLPPLVAPAGQSELRLEGGLAGRRLLAPLELKSWPHPEILANSVVEVLVDAEGRPVLSRLISSSGLPAADQHALEQARAARFESASRNQPGAASSATAQSSSGRMVFRWHTLPPPPAGSPSTTP